MDGNDSQKLEKGNYLAEIHLRTLEGLIHPLSTLVFPLLLLLLYKSTAALCLNL